MISHRRGVTVEHLQNTIRTLFMGGGEMSNVIQLQAVKGEPRVSSRIIACQLGNRHKGTFQLISQYSLELKSLGVLPFQMEKLWINHD